MRAETTSDANNRMRVMKSILFSLLIGIIVSIVVLMIFSLVITLKHIPQGLVPTFSAISVAIGGFSSGLSCAKFLKRDGLIFGLISGGCLFIMLALTGLAFGQSDINYLTAIRLAISLICGALGGVLGVNTRKSKKY